MKSLLLFLLLSLLFSLSQSKSKTPKTIFQLLDQLKMGTWQALKEKDCKSVIGVGGTGVGKSAGLDLLAGHTLQIVSTTDSTHKAYTISKNYSHYSAISPIGMTKSSETSLPIHVGSKKDNTVEHFDTAGGSDTRMYTNEVINYYGYEKMIELAQNMKLLIFVDQIGLENNKLEDTLGELNLADDFTDSVGIIITKVSYRNGTEEKYLRELLYNKTEDIIHRGVRGAEVIKCAYVFDAISFFSTPERLQILNRTLEQQRVLIQKMVDNLTYASPNQVRRFLNIGMSYVFQEKIKATQSVFLRSILDNITSIQSHETEFDQTSRQLVNGKINKKEFMSKVHEIIRKVYGKQADDNYIPFLEFLAQKTNWNSDLNLQSQ